MFSNRTAWNLEPNPLSKALADRLSSGKPVIDLTESNPTKCGFHFEAERILRALSGPAGLNYDPSPQGLLTARNAVVDYYRSRNCAINVSDIFLTTSTSEAYSRLGPALTRALSRKRGQRLTKEDAVSKLWCFCALCWSPRGAGLSNDFEPAVFPWYPRLGRIRRELLKYGAAEASLAGSGSAVFAIFRNPAQARRAAQKFPEDRVFLSTTQSRRAYTRALWGAAGVFTGGY